MDNSKIVIFLLLASFSLFSMEERQKRAFSDSDLDDTFGLLEEALPDIDEPGFQSSKRAKTVHSGNVTDYLENMELLPANNQRYMELLPNEIIMKIIPFLTSVTGQYADQEKLILAIGTIKRFLRADKRLSNFLSDYQCNKELIEYLCLNTKDQNPITVACELYTHGAGLWLKEYAHQTPENFEKIKMLFFDALDQRNLKQITFLLKYMPQLAIVKNKTGFSTLTYAANSCPLKIMQLLITAGVDLEQQDPDGDNALSIAIVNNKPLLVQLLLCAGANANVLSKRKTTPLMLACEYLHFPLVEILLNAKADVNLQNKFGETALLCAINAWGDGKEKEKRLPIVERLLAAGANPNIPVSGGSTALMESVSAGYTSAPIVKALIKAGAHINYQSPNNGNTPLLEALSDPRLEIIKILIEEGADVRLKNSDGQDALAIARSLSDDLLDADHDTLLVKEPIIRLLKSKNKKRRLLN